MRTTSITAAIVTSCAAAALLLPSAHAAPAETGVVDSIQPLSPAATLPGSVNSVRITYSSTGAGDVPTQTSAAVYFPPGRHPRAAGR